ncbi:phosphatidylcholine/phosphatidylserine synthase [Sphingomonas sp. G-3-2-10]|jgi:CDP-diacylglycerol--serine O-phosphatidyltransferase|uniref:CDP-alcohol phosphatidyltransferase family protein n=1 Tax=Sphingomonas sp. G-3-2-10 TaxID=2728838 RepID=UPI00146A031C|nr:phosphatidylcholine/phosphatidylserine synthase [Sphingomonas sp. G-3-2-10]NML05199.1 phosphatidylcholine/phosphatidylserine synthase [Sphingomonas sp. G-3-2-10]
MKPPRIRAPRAPRPQRGIPLRTILPNAVTALALCSGLSSIRFAMDEKWEIAVMMVLIAGVLDGIDGRIARLVRGESRFGAELDSLSDAISFGVAPALILFMWSLHDVSRLGWLLALVYALFCALRLARFNAQIDQTVQPHKSAGFLTGVPAPAGAAIVMMPLYLWLSTGLEQFRSPWLVGPWTAFAAILMISSIATWSGASLKLRQRIRFEAIAVLVVLAAAVVSAPWQSLTGIVLLYLATIPFSVRAYRRIRRLREAGQGPASATEPSGLEP